MDFSVHQKKFPADIAEYFRSSWETRDLWSLETPRKAIPIAEFAWHLDYPFCSSDPPAPLFDLTPRTVLAKPHEFPRHWRRVIDADLKYPIHVSVFGGRWVILDGIHRLLKSITGGMAVMDCRLVPREHLRVAAEKPLA